MVNRLSTPFPPFLSLLLLFLLAGCVQQLAIRTMADIMQYGFDAYYQEEDLEFAREGLAGNIKIIEALIKGDPENEELLLLASQGYSAYALGFMEDDSVERARVFYLRGMTYGKRALGRHKELIESMGRDLHAMQEALKTMDAEDVPAVFWTAFAWGGYINISRDDLSAFADLPQVIAMMEFVAEKDPGYYYGGAYMFLGALEGSVPPVLGGRPEKAKEYFEKALAVSEGRFLMSYVYFARTYAVQMLDEELFDRCLKAVEEASPDILPEARLPNAIAKEKARRLRERKAELF
ncbi:MAG: hypothetical protein HBSIN02_18060 [Bacteroidia bacterium]|nr:MAG: hypothetical protein HBSIN02_18060 [Bacteroidia bacterium]